MPIKMIPKILEFPSLRIRINKNKTERKNTVNEHTFCCRGSIVGIVLMSWSFKVKVLGIHHVIDWGVVTSPMGVC